MFTSKHSRFWECLNMIKLGLSLCRVHLGFRKLSDEDGPLHLFRSFSSCERKWGDVSVGPLVLRAELQSVLMSLRSFIRRVHLFRKPHIVRLLLRMRLWGICPWIRLFRPISFNIKVLRLLRASASFRRCCSVLADQDFLGLFWEVRMASISLWFICRGKILPVRRRAASPTRSKGPFG